MNDLEAMLRGDSGGGLGGPPPELKLPDELVDVAYAYVDSPLGKLLVAATQRGLVRVAYLDEVSEGELLQALSDRISPRVVRASARLDRARRELDEFFAGRRQGFDLVLDWQLTRGFMRDVLAATNRIPYGEVSSYKVVAQAAGSPRAYRAAGNALGANPLPIVVPCHRVLASGGKLGGYTGGVDRKLALLTLEGREL